MKISKIVLITALSLPIFGFAQNVQVPKVIMDAFNAEYGNFNKTEVLAWSMTWTTNDDKFIAKIDSDGSKSEITYNTDGQKLESLVEISKERLSSANLEYIKSNYSKAKIQTVYLQNSAVAPERIVIDIIENGKTIRLFFRPDGTFFEEKR
jgi:hypothetical protein